MIASFDQNPANGMIATSASVPTRNVQCVSGMERRRPPISRMSCSPESRWITSPAARNKSPLKNAWVTRWNIANP